MRAINRLSTVTVRSLAEPGLHADGQGLYLRIDQTISKRWVLVYFWKGKRREMGLGSAAPGQVGLKEARDAAEAARRLVKRGIDPIADRKVQQSAGMTFGQLATRVIADLAPGWTNHRSEAQWTSSLTIHARPIWKTPVSDVDTDAVRSLLAAIWMKTPETASRVRSRIEYVLDVAKIEGLREGENPARWRGHIQLLMPRHERGKGHHAALGYETLPAFLAELRARPATAARALEFAILGAVRTTEVREARWSEIEGDIWVIPAERMKAGVEHRVPLTAPMLTILEGMKPLRTTGDYIFPGDQRIEPLSRMAMLMLLRRMETKVTVHGFRSTFRDWAGDLTEFPREIIEQALAHTVGSDVEKAYRRGTAIARRRKLMEAWAAYCARPASNVHQLVTARPTANAVRRPP